MSFRSLRVAALGVLLSTAAHAQTYPTSTFANIIDRGVVAGDVLLGGGTAGPIVGFVPGAGVVTALGIGVNTSGGAALLNGAATSGHCLQWSVTGVQDAGTACGGTGTVTSIAANFTGGLVSVGGSPVTTSGTFAFTVAGTSGGVPYFSSASTWASSAALAANSLVKGGGAGVAPATITTGTGVLTALGITTNASGGAALVNGTPTSGNCLKWSATGVQDNGAACAGAFSISFPQTVGGTTNSGGIPYFSNATTLTTSSVLAANSVLIGGGAGASPSSTTTGSGVLTALGVNTGSAGAFVVNGGALGTPSSGVGTNLTGIPTTALTGALQAAQEPAHTGDMTNTAGSLATVVTKTNGVSFGALATVTPGTGVATALAIATNANGGTGLVNGTPVSGDCLKWSATGVQDSGAACGTGAGSVTSVGETFTGGLISVAGSPITTAGTFALTVAGTSGGIPYFSSASTWATSAALAANAVVLGGGAGASPTAGGAGIITTLAVSGATGTNVGLTVTGATQTGSNAAVATSINTTWNTSGLPTALDINVTDTATGTGSGNSNHGAPNLINATFLTSGGYYELGRGSGGNLFSYLSSGLGAGNGPGYFVGLTSDVESRAVLSVNLSSQGELSFGPGASPGRDVRLYRSSSGVITVTGGTVPLSVNGAVSWGDALGNAMGRFSYTSSGPTGTAALLSVNKFDIYTNNAVGSPVMSFLINGNIGVANTNPSNLFDVNGVIGWRDGGGNPMGRFSWSTSGAGGTAAIIANNALDIYTNNAGGSPSITMLTTGVVRLPQITSDAALTDSTVCQDTTNHALFSGSGTLGICLGTSSARYKHDVSDLGLGLHAIMGLQPKRYFLDRQHGDPAKPYYGFLAEDGVGVLPELVGNDNVGRPNTFDYLGIVPILVRAVQEQQAEIQELRKAMR